MKKCTCITIIIGLLLLCLPTVSAAPWEEFGDFGYRIVEDGLVVWYSGSDEDVIFPNEINSYPVVSCSGVLNTSREITSAVIPEGVVRITNQAFEHCLSLTSVTLPESLVEIGDRAFERCESLTSITIPQGVTAVGKGAFSHCTSLAGANILGSVIGSAMFVDCSSLTELNISGNVTSIGSEAFAFCSSLTALTIPESVETIQYEAFKGCSALTSVTIPESVTSMGFGVFFRCENLENVIFLNSDMEFKEITEDNNPIFPKLATFDFCESLSNLFAFRNTRAQSYALDNELNFVPIARVELNGERLRFDVPPVIENDRVLVPLRVIFEALGAEVAWNGDTKTVTAQTTDKFLSLQIGNTQMQLGNETVTLDVPAQIVLDRTVVPVRAVSEGLNATVDWNEETQTVVINTR